MVAGQDLAQTCCARATTLGLARRWSTMATNVAKACTNAVRSDVEAATRFSSAQSLDITRQRNAGQFHNCMTKNSQPRHRSTTLSKTIPACQSFHLTQSMTEILSCLKTRTSLKSRSCLDLFHLPLKEQLGNNLRFFHRLLRAFLQYAF